MLRDILVPSESVSSYKIPPEWYGKKIRITLEPVESEFDMNAGCSSESEVEAWIKELEESTPYEWPPRLATDEEVAKLSPWRRRERELAAMTPQERAAEEADFAAYVEEMRKWNLAPIEGDWYREWKTECMGYDYDYYDRIYGKETEQ